MHACVFKHSDVLTIERCMQVCVNIHPSNLCKIHIQVCTFFIKVALCQHNFKHNRLAKVSSIMQDDFQDF